MSLRRDIKAMLADRVQIVPYCTRIRLIQALTDNPPISILTVADCERLKDRALKTVSLASARMSVLRWEWQAPTDGWSQARIDAHLAMAQAKVIRLMAELDQADAR